MDTKEIFEETRKLGNELEKTQEKIKCINKQIFNMAEKCSHEIVFLYKDNHPRKNTFIENYFCPACGRTLNCFNKNQIYESIFNNSRVIPLTHLSLNGSSELYKTIRQEVYDNLDYYYNKNISTYELSISMESNLIEIQENYERLEKEFIKKYNK